MTSNPGCQRFERTEAAIEHCRGALYVARSLAGSVSVPAALGLDPFARRRCRRPLHCNVHAAPTKAMPAAPHLACQRPSPHLLGSYCMFPVKEDRIWNEYKKAEVRPVLQGAAGWPCRVGHQQHRQAAARPGTCPHGSMGCRLVSNSCGGARAQRGAAGCRPDAEASCARSARSSPARLPPAPAPPSPLLA